VDRVDQGGS
jgi:hypothetical protein